MLQKRFVNERGNLWTFDNRRPEKGVREDRPGNLLLVGHLYTLVNADGSKDASLESDFSKLEGAADPIIEKIRANVLKGRLPNLSSSERDDWNAFFLQQWRRVPDLHDSLFSEEMYRAEVDRSLAEFEHQWRPVTDDERASLLTPEKVRRALSNLRVQNLRRRSDLIAGALGDRGLIFARVINPKKSLIMASRPVVKVTPGGVTILSDDRVAAWLAISPEIAVSPGSSIHREYLMDFDDRYTRLLNLAMSEQSNQIIGRSKELVSSLARFVGSAIAKQPPADCPEQIESDNGAKV